MMQQICDFLVPSSVSRDEPCGDVLVLHGPIVEQICRLKNCKGWVRTDRRVEYSAEALPDSAAAAMSLQSRRDRVFQLSLVIRYIQHDPAAAQATQWLV